MNRIFILVFSIILTTLILPLSAGEKGCFSNSEITLCCNDFVAIKTNGNYVIGVAKDVIDKNGRYKILINNYGWYDQSFVYPLLSEDNRGIKVGVRVVETFSNYVIRNVVAIIENNSDYSESYYVYKLSDGYWYHERVVFPLLCLRPLHPPIQILN